MTQATISPDPQSAEHDDAPVTASKTAHPDRALLAEAVTINRPAEELFAFWRQPGNLVGVLENVLSIEPVDANLSRWTVAGPAGTTYTWDARVTAEVPGREITWQSEPGGEIANSGRVTFEPVAGRGTVVRAVIAYDPPGGVVGQIVAKLFQREPRIQTRRDLRRFKQLMEAGEISTAARNARIRAERGED